MNYYKTQMMSKAKEIVFDLKDNKLLVSHDGGFFGKSDIERICAYATHASEQPGNKGI